MHLVVALAFFLAGVVHLAWVGATPASLQRASMLVALGGFVPLIFGTSRLLLAGMAGRAIAGPKPLGFVVLALACMGALAAFAAPSLPRRVAIAGSVLWGIATLAHVVTMVATVKRHPIRPPVKAPEEHRWVRRLRRPVGLASLAYAAVAAVLVPLSFTGRVAPAAALHVLLVGFVTTTVVAVGLRIVPLFTRRAVPVALLAPLVTAAVVGPALVARGLGGGGGGGRGALLAGLVAQGIALALFVVIVAWLLVRARKTRVTFVGYGAGCVAIGVGGGIAVGFPLGGASVALYSVHGVLNLLGFVGMFVLAASTDLYAPSLKTGARPALLHARLVLTLAIVGVAGAAVAILAGRQDAARLALAVYAAAVALQLAGAFSAHRRAGRILTRLRAA